MHNLEGRVSALDSFVHESVKIISYFDALVSERVGVDGLLRAAALLAGCPAGVMTGTRPKGRRVDVGGKASSGRFEADHGWPSKWVQDDQVLVWIERNGGIHVNDEMLLERLALATVITFDRTTRRPPRAAIEVLTDALSRSEEKEAMARALGLSVTKTARVVVSPAPAKPASIERLSSVLPTEVGPITGGPLSSSGSGRTGRNRYRHFAFGSGLIVPKCDYRFEAHYLRPPLKDQRSRADATALCKRF